MLNNFTQQVPNKYILLTIIPCFLATLGLANGGSSLWAVVGPVALLLFIIGAWLDNKKQLPAWSLMSLGALVQIGFTAIIGVLGVFAAMVTHTTASPVSSPYILAIPWIGVLVMAFFIKPQRQFASRIWLLAAAIVFCCILIRVKYFVLYGLSWDILRQMMGVSLWAAGTLLFPIILAGLLARRFGEQSILFMVGAVFVWSQVLIDNGFHISEILGSPAAFWAYLFVIQFFFIGLGPWLFLRLKNMRSQLTGLIVCMIASVTINILFSGIMRGDFILIYWLASIPYVISIGLCPLLAYWLFRGVDNARNQTITEGGLTPNGV